MTRDERLRTIRRELGRRLLRGEFSAERFSLEYPGGRNVSSMADHVRRVLRHARILDTPGNLEASAIWAIRIHVKAAIDDLEGLALQYEIVGIKPCDIEPLPEVVFTIREMIDSGAHFCPADRRTPVDRELLEQYADWELRAEEVI